MTYIKVAPQNVTHDHSEHDSQKLYYIFGGYPVYREEDGDFMRKSDIEELLFLKHHSALQLGIDDIREGQGRHDAILDYLFKYGSFRRSDLPQVEEFAKFIYYGFHSGGFIDDSYGNVILPRMPHIHVSLTLMGQQTIDFKNTRTGVIVSLPLKL